MASTLIRPGLASPFLVSIMQAAVVLVWVCLPLPNFKSRGQDVRTWPASGIMEHFQKLQRIFNVAVKAETRGRGRPSVTGRQTEAA